MKYLLYGNTFYTFLLGLLFVLFPFVIFDPMSEAAKGLARVLGFAIVSMGFLSLIMSRMMNNKQAVLLGLFTLATFHAGFTITQVVNSLQHLVPAIVPFISGLFMVTFIYFTRIEMKQLRG
jgi:hypothetical protein